MKWKCRLLCVLLALFCTAAMTACGETAGNTEEGFPVYYVGNSNEKVEVHRQALTSDTQDEMLKEVLTYLAQKPAKLEYQAPLAMGFALQGYYLEEGKLRLDMDASYQELPAITEILVRAALVRTLCGLDFVNLVEITVNDGAIYDSVGVPISWMSAEQFIDNDGNEINTYESAKLLLYFANEEGNSLYAAYRDKHYLSNTPIERVLIDELLAGPSGQVAGLYPTINPATKVLNVTTKDGICYVNLDSSFLTVVNNVPTEVSIYSIVNSLVELSNVNKVQILINGEVPAGFSESGYERNLDIVIAWEL